MFAICEEKFKLLISSEKYTGVAALLIVCVCYYLMAFLLFISTLPWPLGWNTENLESLRYLRHVGHSLECQKHSWIFNSSSAKKLATKLCYIFKNMSWWLGNEELLYSLHPMQYYCGAIMNSVVKGFKISMYIHIYFGLLFKALGVRCLLCMVLLEEIGSYF